MNRPYAQSAALRRSNPCGCLRSRFGALLLTLPLVVPAASGPKPDERVVLYPALGWRVPGGWEIELQGSVFEPEQRTLAMPLLRRVLGIDDDQLTAAEKGLFRERARQFLVDHQDDRSVQIRFAGSGDEVSSLTLGPSDGGGRFATRTVLLDERVPASASASGFVRIEALPPGVTAPVLANGEVQLLAETGWSVVTDIDDTIKLSDVRQRRELLLNTFCRPFRPVPGMAARYADWARTNGAAFHYVSASPSQLYPALAEFVRSNGFPAGSFHLKPCRVKDGTAFQMKEPPARHKLAVLVPLLERYPRRNFILVGDSGEMDPEIYADLARRFPKQIRAICIRDVTGENLDSARYQPLTAGQPAGLWYLFKEPSALPPRWH